MKHLQEFAKVCKVHKVFQYVVIVYMCFSSFVLFVATFRLAGIGIPWSGVAI